VLEVAFGRPFSLIKRMLKWLTLKRYSKDFTRAH
jgi:hypothetical protein